MDAPLVLPMNRRVFLGSAAVAMAVASSHRAEARASRASRPAPLGPVVGRTGPDGLSPGTPSDPSQGPVILLDGRTLTASHITGWKIGPGKSVLIAPEPDGAWSILYAEA